MACKKRDIGYPGGSASSLLNVLVIQMFNRRKEDVDIEKKQRHTNTNTDQTAT